MGYFRVTLLYFSQATMIKRYYVWMKEFRSNKRRYSSQSLSETMAIADVPAWLHFDKRERSGGVARAPLPSNNPQQHKNNHTEIYQLHF